MEYFKVLLLFLNSTYPNLLLLYSTLLYSTLSYYSLNPIPILSSSPNYFLDLFELDPSAGERNGLFEREEVGLGDCFAADLVICAARDEVSVTSAPPLVDLPLPEASGMSRVSGPVLLGVGVKTGSLTVGTIPRVLEGLRVILSSSLMKEGRSRDLGVTNVIGSGVEPAYGVGSSLIRSATGSSGPVCIVSIWAGCGDVSTL